MIILSYRVATDCIQRQKTKRVLASSLVWFFDPDLIGLNSIVLFVHRQRQLRREHFHLPAAMMKGPDDKHAIHPMSRKSNPVHLQSPGVVVRLKLMCLKIFRFPKQYTWTLTRPLLAAAAAGQTQSNEC